MLFPDGMNLCVLKSLLIYSHSPQEVCTVP